MAISLASLVTQRPLRPPMITIYGAAGVGKTTFGASAPKPVFILTEDGLGRIQATSFPLAKSFDVVLDALDALLTEEHDFETLVVDSLDWLEPLIWAQVALNQGVNTIDDIGYGKGYGFAQDLWRVYLDKINRLRNEKNLGIIQIAHHQVKRFDSPETDPYDRFEIKLHPKAAALIQEHSDVVGFANYKVSVTKTDVGFGKNVARGVGGELRTLYVQERPAALAKNRYQLPPEMPLDWPTFAACLTGPEPKPTTTA